MRLSFSKVVEKLITINCQPLFDENWFVKNYEDSNSKIDIVDQQGYKYKTIVGTLLLHNTFRKWHAKNPYTIENIKHWLKLENKPFSLVDNQNYISTHAKLKWVCCKCKQTFECTFDRVSQGNGCGVCHGKQVCGKHNSFIAIRPDLVRYFETPESAEKITLNSNKKISFICPNCGYKKEMRACSLVEHGFSCNRCSDGVSIPNKFVFGILNQLNVKFKPEYRFKKCENKYQYDFYLPECKKTIEAHGIQHYEAIKRKSKRSLLEEQENDKAKKIFSESLGNVHIEIDCRESDYKYLKEKCENSLKEYFDLSTIDWVKVYKYCNTSLVLQVCKLWNGGSETSFIANALKISICTVVKYLHRGTKAELCFYNGKAEMKKNCLKNLHKRDD